MSRFAKLAVATVATTLVLIALGGFVRAMEAGLGCPDWPTCHGALNPPSTLGYGMLKLAWIEHSHRLVAAVLIAQIVALAIAAKRTGQPRHVRVVTYLLVPAVLSQAVIGAVVVWLELDAASVLLHLGGAMVVLGMAVHVMLHALGRGREVAERPASRGLAVLSLVTLAVTVGQMLLGSAVTGWHAGLAWGTFPTFGGRWLPPLVAQTQHVLHVAHRFTAYLVALLVVALWWRARREGEPLVRRAAALATGLVAVQIGLGAANIWWELSAWSVAPHLAVGSWIVAVLTVVALRTRWAAQVAVAAPERARGLRAVPADPAAA